MKTSFPASASLVSPWLGCPVPSRLLLATRKVSRQAVAAVEADFGPEDAVAASKSARPRGSWRCDLRQKSENPAVFGGFWAVLGGFGRFFWLICLSLGVFLVDVSDDAK